MSQFMRRRWSSWSMAARWLTELGRLRWTGMETGKAAAMDDDTLPQDERDAAEEKWQELLHAHSKGGKVSGQAGQAADRVRKTIKAKIDEWRGLERTKGKPNRVLQAFSKHLEQCLWLPSVGGRSEEHTSELQSL